jgi:hypothetical protein
MSVPDPIPCYRCGQPGYVNWVEITAFRDPEPRYTEGESYCVTPGCADEDGSRRLRPLTAAQLRERSDAAWLRRHRAIAGVSDFDVDTTWVTTKDISGRLSRSAVIFLVLAILVFVGFVVGDIVMAAR